MVADPDIEMQAHRFFLHMRSGIENVSIKY